MSNSEKSNDNQTGLICPAPGCGFKIKFTMQDFLMKKEIVYPACNPSLEMNVPVAIKKHLQEIVLAEKISRDPGKVPE